ncbi:MAG: FHA domain-containing protein [Myxococcota bacterium]
MTTPSMVLRVLKSPEGSALAVGTTFTLRKSTTVVGRSPAADVVLPDLTVSREHVRIDIGTRVLVTALTASNGTFLDRHRLTPGTPRDAVLKGAELQLGGVILDLFVLGDTTPVFEPLTQTVSPSLKDPLLVVTWDAGQCSARTGRRDLGLTAGPARFLGLLADRAGEVVHYWDLEHELQTSHLAPLASLVRQAFLAAITSGAIDEGRVRLQIGERTGRPCAEVPLPQLMRHLLQSRRGHGYILNLSDVEVIRV